jgi:nucleotide-binding universal stress UspA family protein
MISPKHILLPVDFSERSLDAAREAEVLARHFHSCVTVLHVADPHENEFGGFEPGGVKARELEKVLAHDFTGASISRIVREGGPAEEIVGFASASRVDLIVMAGHAYQPFESFLVGSVAADVLRNANCPVWLSFRAEKGLPPIFRRVLCAVDLAPRTESVINWAAEFAAAFTAQLFVLHVFRNRESDPPPDDPNTWLSHAEREELEKARQKLGATAQILFAGGNIPEAVCRQAAKQAAKLHADLVVIGRSPKAGDVGTTRIADYIRKSPCPVVRI